MSSRPRWPGSPTRASWSRSRMRPGPVTAPWRPSASTGPASWRGTASRIRLPPGTWAGAWTPPPPSRCLPAMTGPGGRPSISWPTSCAPRCAGRPAPSAGRRRTGWRSRWPSCPSPAVFPASPSGGTSRPRGSRRTTATRPPRCAAPPGAAKSRHFGDDALRLLQEAADAAVRAGEAAAAAADLAEAAEMLRPHCGADGHRSGRRPGARADRPRAGRWPAGTWPRSPGC